MRMDFFCECYKNECGIMALIIVMIMVFGSDMGEVSR